MSDYNAALALSRGLHNFLANQVHIQDHLGNPPRLYDDPPEDPIFPYLTYGPLRSENISAEGAVITQHVLSLHLWSRYNGRTETLELVGLAHYFDRCFSRYGWPYTTRHYSYAPYYRT